LNKISETDAKSIFKWNADVVERQWVCKAEFSYRDMWAHKTEGELNAHKRLLHPHDWQKVISANLGFEIRAWSIVLYNLPRNWNTPSKTEEHGEMDRSGTTENKTLCFYNHSAGVGEF
jgi:hypothetical protein